MLLELLLLLVDIHISVYNGSNDDNAGEQILLEFVEKLKSNKETGSKGEALWSDFSQRMFTLLPSTRPYVFRDFHDIADHVSA